MTVYFRHRRHSKIARYAEHILNFISAQNTRLLTAAVKATGTLTASALADTDTVTIAGKVYTFQTTLTNVNGNVKRTGTLATDLANLRKALNLSGSAGTDYAVLMTAHATVDPVSSDATHLLVRAKTGGTAGNALATTETSATASWGGTTLAGGAAAIAFNTETKLRKYTAAQILAASTASQLP